MESKTFRKDLETTKEILKMTDKIVKRYQITNISLATSVAISLYEKGINLDKFQEQYYQGMFDLDEIVEYLLTLKLREEKIINFQQRTSSNSEYLSIKNTSLNQRKEKTNNKIIRYRLSTKKQSSTIIQFP